MTPCTNMNDILNIEDPDIDMSQPVDMSALEQIESEVAESVQAHRAYDLFESLVEKKDYKHARKVAWLLWSQHKIDVGLTD